MENNKAIIQSFIQEAEKIKEDHPELWNDKYEQVLLEIKRISDLGALNEERPYIEFMKLEVAKYRSFTAYMSAKDIRARNLKVQTVQKQNKKKKICYNCGCEDFIFNDGYYICSRCNVTITFKNESQLVAKDNIDNSKHITKQLNILTGRIDPPAMMRKIMPYVEEWFKDRSHIYEWLKYRNKIDKWIKIYNEYSNKPVIDESYFDQKIEPGIEHVCNARLFRLYTDEFYDLTELVKKMSKYENNISKLPENVQIGICRDYYEYYHRVPKEDELFCYSTIGKENKYDNNDYVYSIGKYIIQLKISDYESKTVLKKEMNKIFNQELRLPGLIFNYSTLYGTKDNLPKKFVYQQNYIFIVRLIYNLKSYEILEDDKQTICKIILDFNNYLKQVKKNRTNKNHNSCLWQISLAYILELPYFRCYKDIIKILPIKLSNTLANIKEIWLLYLILNHDQMKQYTDVLRTEIKKSSENVRTIITDAVIDKKDVADFVLNTGEAFNAEKNYAYLRNKFNSEVIAHEWTNKFTIANFTESISESKKEESSEYETSESSEYETSDEN